MIFLIEQLWLDPMENESARAVGYSPHSYVDTKEEALEIIKNSKTYTRKDCWAIMDSEKLKEFRFSKLEKYKV